MRVTCDEATNSLVTTSSLRDYAQLRAVINKLDQPRRQVFIEAVIMDVGVKRELGFGLGYHAGAPFDAPVGDGDAFIYGGNNPGQSITGVPANLEALALGVRGPDIPNSQGVTGVGVSIPAFGVVMHALAKDGNTNVLATPHILCTDNIKAEISIGQNIPLQTNIGGSLGSLASLAGGGQQAGAASALSGLLGGGMGFNAPRQDVGTKITVTPHVNDSDQVRLELQEEISEADAPTGALGAVPINKRTASTTLIVRDQQTVVIGGLMRDSITEGETKIPVLGDIPVLGFLFRQSQKTTVKSNLLLVLTPYVIRDQDDLRAIFERKMQERQEFLDRYFVFNEGMDWKPPRDFARANGLVEDIRQQILAQEEQLRLEEEAKPRGPQTHEPGDPIALPSIHGAGGRATTGAAPGAVIREDGDGPATPTPPAGHGPGSRRLRRATPAAQRGARGVAMAGGERVPRRDPGTPRRRHPGALDVLYETVRDRGQPLTDVLVQANVTDEAKIGQRWPTSAGCLRGQVDVDARAVATATRIPIGYAKAHRILAMAEDDDCVHCVVADPFDTVAVDDVRTVFSKPVELTVSTSEAVLDAINRVWEKKEDAGTQLEGDRHTEEDNLIDIIDSDDDAPIIAWVNGLFAQAVRERASDIHIEPEERDVVVRYRIDGELYIAKRAPKQFMSPIIARVKIMASLNIAEKRLPQDGRITLKIAGKSVDIRVSTVPTSRGFGAHRHAHPAQGQRPARPRRPRLRAARLRADGHPDPEAGRHHPGHRPTARARRPRSTPASTASTSEPQHLTAEDPVEYEIGGIHQVTCTPASG